ANDLVAIILSRLITMAERLICTLKAYIFMARPKLYNNRDLPFGLTFRKDRQVYQFTRIDGSKRCLGTNRAKAKQLAFQYNCNYRVDPELVHGILKNKSDVSAKKSLRFTIARDLEKAFQWANECYRWAEGTKKIKTQHYIKIVEFFGVLHPNNINLENVNRFLKLANPTNSKDVNNRLLYLINLLFDYLVSESVLAENPAKKKKRAPIIAKNNDEIIRVSKEDFLLITNECMRLGLHWLWIAMNLSLQTTHAVNEICNLKFEDIDNDLMHIKRQKNKKNAASNVQIPMSNKLNEIVEFAKTNGVPSPFIVHRVKQHKKNVGAKLEHPTQLRTEEVSRAFSKIRDSLGLFASITKDKRPGFHSIRSLSITIYESMGLNAQKRAAHAKEETTALYRKGHVNWNVVENMEIDV
ncbi:MAG: integrase, partial [Paraglaciecola sp.]